MIKKYFIIITLGIVFLFYLFYLIGTTKITVQFEDLEPLKHHLPVYYNGFKLGHTTKVYPNRDYNSTMIDLRLVLKNIEFPDNTFAILKRKDKKDYIELKIPDVPSVNKLHHKDIIKGHLGVNFERFLQNQSENGGLDELKESANQTLNSISQTFDVLTEMFQVATDILKENKPLIYDSMNNVNKTSKNLADSSFEIKKSLKKGHLDKSLYNLEKTSGILVASTNNFSGFTNNLNKKNTIQLNCLLQNLNTVVCNINQIVVGLGNTLKKRFGGLRIIFGKTIS